VFHRVLWERRLHQGGSAKGLSLTSDQVVVHERCTRLVGLDRWTGSLRWDVSIGTHPRAVVTVGDRCLVLAQDSDQLFCLDVRTGGLLWNIDLPRWSGHVVTTADTVLVGGWRGYTPLMAFDLQAGARRWHTARRLDTVLPVPAGEGVLVGAPGGTKIRLVDRRNGEELSCWRLPEPLISSDDRPAFTPVGADRFLARCGQRSVVDIRLSSADVRELVRAEADLVSTAVEYTAGALWLRELHGGYVAVDPADGHVLWRVFLVDSVGQVLKRTAVARRIAALRSGGSAELLVRTKGTLLAVAVLD
jgi:outer membrane protein assembly factor BamB